MTNLSASELLTRLSSLVNSSVHKHRRIALFEILYLNFYIKYLIDISHTVFGQNSWQIRGGLLGGEARELVFSQSCAAALLHSYTLLHSFTALTLPKKAPHVPAEGISYDRLPPKYYIPALLPALSQKTQ